MEDKNAVVLKDTALMGGQENKPVMASASDGRKKERVDLEELYARFKRAGTMTSSMGEGPAGPELLEEERFFNSLDSETLYYLQMRKQDEDHTAQALAEFSGIRPTEIAHDRREMAKVVDRLIAGAEKGEVTRFADYHVDGMSPTSVVRCYRINNTELSAKGYYFSLLGQDDSGRVVGYYEGGTGRSKDGILAGGTMMVDVMARGRGWGGALNRAAKDMFQRVANISGVNVLRRESNRNASLGRLMEQRRWQRLFGKEDFVPKEGGAGLDPAPGMVDLDRDNKVVGQRNFDTLLPEVVDELKGLRGRVVS